MGPTLTATKIAPIAASRECPERWKLTYINHSESDYNGIHPDGLLSEATVYLGPIFATHLQSWSSPIQHPEQRQQVKSQTSQDLIIHMSKNFCFIIEFFQLHLSKYKLWIHLTRVIQVQALILHECILPERKNEGAHNRVLSSVLVMTPKQTIHQGWMSDDTENSQEATS